MDEPLDVFGFAAAEDEVVPVDPVVVALRFVGAPTVSDVTVVCVALPIACSVRRKSGRPLVSGRASLACASSSWYCARLAFWL